VRKFDSCRGHEPWKRVCGALEPGGAVAGPAFSKDFDVEFAVGAEGSALFGRNVLRGLVDGIDDFVEERQERWRR
jgi:hypothetical protein